MTKKKQRWTQLEDYDNCLVHFHCPQCGKEFYERGARLQSGAPIPCRGCGHAWHLDKEQALGMIVKAIDKTREGLERMRGKIGS